MATTSPPLAVEEARTASAPPPRRRRIDPKDFGVVLGLAVIVVGLSLSTSTFLTGTNLVNLLDQMTVVGLLAVGATLCIVSGVFDLSSTATLALSAIIGVSAMQVLGPVLGFVVALLAGTGLGALTGALIVLTRVHSFIGSLAISLVYRGVATVLTGGLIVSVPESALAGSRIWAQPLVLGITAASVLLLAAVAVFEIVLSRTTFGRRVYAVGGNAEAARLSGVRPAAIHIAVFAISGLCASLAGMVLVARAGSAQPAMATGMELLAIAAVVVGGTSILGGSGAVWRTLVGVLLLTVIGNGFNLLRWDTTYQQVVTGGLILIAVTVDGWLAFKARRT